MSLYQKPNNEVIVSPAPVFENLCYAGDGRAFILDGNQGGNGLVALPQGQGLPEYSNEKLETVDGQEYSKFFCDYHVLDHVMLQGADIKVTGAHPLDFTVFEVLYLADQALDLWVLGCRFVRRFYLSTDFEDQDTPRLPYAKELSAGLFMMRLVYYKHNQNLNRVYARCNYTLHAVTS